MRYSFLLVLTLTGVLYATETPSTGGVTTDYQAFAGRKVLQADALLVRGALSGAVTILRSDSTYETADPNGSDRNLTLPAVELTGMRFEIANVGSANNLVIKDPAASTIVTVAAGQVGVVSCTGTSWVGFTYVGSNISGTLASDGTTTGASAQAQVFTNGVKLDALTGNTATTLAIASKTASAAAGNPITITASAGNGNTNAGGAITLTTGAGVTSGAGGAYTVTPGAGGATGTGGALSLRSGASAGAGGTAGAVSLDNGAATGGTAGAITIGTSNAASITIGQASKATIIGGPATLSVGASTAAAGNATGNATALPAGTASVYPTTAADDTKGVIITSSDQVTGRTLFIGNGVSNKILKVYGPSGAVINGAAADAAFSSASGKGVIITCLSGVGNTWLAW